MIDANILLLLTFIILMLIGTPIAVALGIGGVIGIAVGLDTAALGTLGTNTYNAVAKYPLIAIPLFILTGMVFERSGVAARLVSFAQACIGPRRGGLALVAVLVCLIMGGMSGSGPADAAAVATVMLPSMMKAGYPKPFSASVIAASASTAILIPPSIALIVYSVLVPGTDLRALFAAGLIPGLLVGLSIAIPTLILSRKHDFGAGESPDRPAFWPALWRAIPGLMAPVIILGGLRSGLFTPTETAVVAVFYGLLVGTALYRTMGFRDIYQVLVERREDLRRTDADHLACRHLRLGRLDHGRLPQYGAVDPDHQRQSLDHPAADHGCAAARGHGARRGVDLSDHPAVAGAGRAGLRMVVRLVRRGDGRSTLPWVSSRPLSPST